VNEQAATMLLTDCFNFDHLIYLIDIIEDTETIHPQFPFGNLIGPQPLVIPGFPSGLMRQTPFDFVNDPLSVMFLEKT
jgi:hypothetical protein